MQNIGEPSRGVGVRLLEDGQIRLDSFAYNADDAALHPGRVTVRSEVWPQWLITAREELASARDARDANPGLDAVSEFDNAVLHEYRSAMICICAVAFTLEAFTNSVVARYPHVQRPSIVRSNGGQSSAAARHHQIWTGAFRLTNTNSANTKNTLKQIFALRNAAVHASADFVDPVGHPVFRVALEGRFVTYTVENATDAYMAAVDALEHLLGRPRGEAPEWLAWCAAMSTRLTTINSPPLTASTSYDTN